MRSHFLIKRQYPFIFLIVFLGGFIGSPCMFIRDNWLLFSQFCCMSCDQRNLDKLLWYLGLQILVIINHLRLDHGKTEWVLASVCTALGKNTNTSPHCSGGKKNNRSLWVLSGYQKDFVALRASEEDSSVWVPAHRDL